ncbi:Sugar or nucleoside kinase, ribokinase family [Frankineae bacterium MT45]|nr:Sugar or nucleoside kinase, ribokinase family [Frankineae bacterium MT45]
MATALDPASRVLVVGDINPDLILRGDVVPRFGQSEQLLDEASLVIGGSAAITAHGLARLRRPVALLGAVGADLYGDEMCRRLSDAGVDISAVRRRSDEPTGLTVVLSGAQDRAILTLLGAIATLTGDEVVEAVDALAGSVSHLHISSLFLQPALAASLPDALAELRCRGISVSLDTNDDPARRWEIDAVLPYVDVLLPNREEVLALAGGDEPRQAATLLAQRGPLVIVKDGAAGAFAVTPDGETLAVPARPATVRDTTGAGDTFNAAFLDAWLDKLELVECLERGVRAGAAAVSATGGTAGQPKRQDLISEKGSTDR